MKTVPILNVAQNITSSPRRFSGTKTYYATADIEVSDFLNGTSVTYDERPSRANLAVKSGDVLFAKMQETEKVIQVNGGAQDAIFSTGFFNLRAETATLHPRYLFWFLRSPIFKSEKDKRCTGATQKALTLSGLREIEIPVPARLEDQVRIAEVLDKADDLRRSRKKAASLTSAFLRSAFLDLFGDPAINPRGFRIDAIANHLSKTRAGTQSGPFGSALKKHEYVEEGIPVWGVDSVQHNEFIPNAKLFITGEKFSQLERYSVAPGDVLISRAGTVGRMCIAKPPVPRSIISTNLVRVVLDASTLLPEYFVALFTYVPHRLGALKANNKDNAFTFLNPKTLRALVIPVPPMDLQMRFKLLLESSENHAARMNEHLDGLDEMFSSISQRAFRGEL